MALSNELAHLPDVLQVTGSGGGVIGFLVAIFFRAKTTVGMLEQVALGAALGGILGLLIGFGLFIGLELAGLLAVADLGGA